MLSLTAMMLASVLVGPAPAESTTTVIVTRKTAPTGSGVAWTRPDQLGQTPELREPFDGAKVLAVLGRPTATSAELRDPFDSSVDAAVVQTARGSGLRDGSLRAGRRAEPAAVAPVAVESAPAARAAARGELREPFRRM
jgi:hypothetical protein